MAVSIYDTPAQSNFINTYVPIPFDEIVQAGLARQNRYDQQLAQLETLREQADLLNAIPGADESYVQGVRQTLKDISSSYTNKDLSDPYTIKDLRENLREGIDRNMVNKIQQSYAGYQQYLNAYNQQRAQGLDLAPEDFSTYDTSMNGVFSRLPEQRLDYAKAAAEFFNQMDPTFKGIIESQGIPGTYHAISNVDIANQAKASVDAFMQTPAGKQYAKGDRNKAYDYLYKVGLEQQKSMFNPLPAGYTKDETQTQFNLPTDESEAINVNIKPTLNVPDVVFNRSGQLRKKGRITAPFEWAFSAVKAGWGDKSWDEMKPYSDFTGISQKDQSEIDSIRGTYPSLNLKSDADIVKEFNSAVKNLSSQSFSLTGISDLAGKDLINDILNNKRARNFVIMDGFGTSSNSLTEKNGVLDELGMNEAEFDDYLSKNWKKVGGFTQDGPEPGMFYIEVPQKSGKHKGDNRRVFISSSNELRRATASSYLINQMVNTLSNGVVRPGLYDPQTKSELAYYINGDIKDGLYTYDIYEGYMNGDQFIPFTSKDNKPLTTTLSSIKKEERAAIANPYFNILGSKIGQTKKGHIR